MVNVETSVEELRERLSSLDVRDIARLPGGASSFTYVGAIAGDEVRRVVVKVAPAGVPPVLNRDVLRQARVLRALHSTDVPVPEVLWEDGGDPPGVPPLFVMAFVAGESFEPLFDLDATPVVDRDLVADRMRAATRAMADLHALVPAALGLDREPVIPLDAEIDRWCRVLETVDAALAPGWKGVATRLRASIPSAEPAALVHGDFRLGNMLAVGPDITAIVDWEIWALSDPRVDLGWFLLTADPETYGRGTEYVGSLPTPAELSGIYADVRGTDVPDLHWFQALACFKSVAVWSLIIKHNRRRAEPDAAIEGVAAALPRLLERAPQLVSATDEASRRQW